jgi:hypothetical protein
MDNNWRNKMKTRTVWTLMKLLGYGSISRLTQRHKNLRRVGCIASVLTSSPDGGEWSASRLGSFTPVKEPPVHIYRRLGEPQSQSGLYGNEKILLLLLVIEPWSGSRSLYRLSYGGSKIRIKSDVTYGKNASRCILSLTYVCFYFNPN